MSLFRVIVERRELLGNLVSRELKTRYRGSALGFLWTVLIPLFMAAVYVVFLRMVAGRGVPIADIIIGVFAWQFTVQCVNSGLNSIVGSANLVKKVYFPRIILVLSATLANLVNYLLSLIVQFPLVAVMLHLQGQPLVSPWLWIFPVVLAFHFLFNFALALILSSTNVYYRDIQHLVGVALSAWFFVSPVMYNLEFVEEHTRAIPGLVELFMLNPMSVIVTGYRLAFMPGTVFPGAACAAACVVATMLFLWLSYRVFQRLEKNFADML